MKCLKLASLVLILLLSTGARAEDDLAVFFKAWRETVAQRLNLALKMRRVDRDLTYANLADNVGVSRAIVSKIANGHASMNVDFGRQFALMLEVSPEWLMAMDVLQSKFKDAEPAQLSKLVHVPGVGRMRRIVTIALSSSVDDIEPTFARSTCELALVSLQELIKELNRRGWYAFSKPTDQEIP